MATKLVAQRQKGPVRATLLMASFGFREANPNDVEFMTMVAQIEQRHAVVVEVDSAHNWLEIYAFTTDSLDKALDAFRPALKLEVGSARVWHPTVLMSPVRVGISDFVALLELTPEGARPYLSHRDGSVTEDSDYNKLRIKWLDDFREKLFQAAQQIRASPSEMRLRVSFGTLLLQEWKKNTTSYTYSELQNVLKRLGIRGTVSFSQMLGTARLARNLLIKIYASPSSFEPVNARISDLQSVKPKHTLILTTDKLKVETEVIHVQETDTSRGVLRLGTAKGYRRERRSRAVEIATSCPEHKYDWNLAVNTRLSVASLPFSHDDIAKHSKFVRRDDPDEFPGFGIHSDFTRAHQVEQIMGKTSWTFKLKGSVYSIEVALYNILAAPSDEGANRLPEGGCGVDLLRLGWDEVLSAHDVGAGARELSENCKELFPFWEKKLADKDGIEAFVRRVIQVHELVDGLDGKAPATVPDEVVPQVEDEDLLLSWDA